MLKFHTILLAAAMSLMAGNVLAACQGNLPAPATVAINTANPDQALFNETVRYYANVERCLNRLEPFETDARLLQAAVSHSRFMANENTMTHNSNIRGMRTLGERMHSFSVAMRTAGENIAQNFVFALGGRSISQSRKGQCGFTYADTRKSVPAHSYASLAQEEVRDWMASPAHRANLMNRRFTRMATALAYAPNEDTCGRYYLTQDFAG